MKDVILASLIAFVLAALIANNPMPPAKSPLGVGSVNHTVYGTKKPENLYPEIQITDDKRIYHFSEKSLINTAPMAWTGHALQLIRSY